MRKLFAVLFALAALVVAAAALPVGSSLEPQALLMQVAEISLAITLALTALYLFRTRTAWERAMVCPHCGGSGLVPCTLAQPRPSVPMMLLGGIVFTVLLQHAQPRRFRCPACGGETRRRTVGSWLAVAWCLVLLLLLATEISAPATDLSQNGGD